MRRIPSAVLAAALLSWPGVAEAQMQQTVGERVRDALSDLVGPFFFLISLLAFCAGLFLFARGLIKIKDASSGKGELRSAFLNIFAAMMLILLPEGAGVGMSSVLGSGGLISVGDLRAAQQSLDAGGSVGQSQGLSNSISRMAGITPPEDCLATGAGNREAAVTCMAKNIALNAVPIGVIAVFAFAFIAGLAMFGGALMELTKTESGRGLPQGWGMKLAVAILLMNAPGFYIAAARTVLGDSGLGTVGYGGVMTGSSLLEYSIGAGAAFRPYEQLIGWVFTILTFFGVWAFVKGIFILKSAGEGRSNSTISHGIVFMVAGILLANSKISACTVMFSVGGRYMGVLAGMCQ